MGLLQAFLQRRDRLEDLLAVGGFVLKGEFLRMDVMPAAAFTEIYEKIPEQFGEKLLINTG